MNTVQSIPLWTISPVTPSLFLLFVSFCCFVKFFSRVQPQTIWEIWRQSAAWEQSNKRAITHYRKDHRVKETKQNKKTTNKKKQTGTKLFVIHGKKRASLLTCTIKASFAKRKCSSLFLGDKRLRERVLDRCREFHEGGFGYLVCHNKGHFCHKHRQCDIGKCSR